MPGSNSVLYLFHRNIVMLLFGNVNGPCPFQELSLIPTISFSAVLTASQASAVIVKTVIGTFSRIGKWFSVTPKLFRGWTLTTTRVAQPFSSTVAETSSHGVLVVLLNHRGSVSPSYAGLNKFVATVQPRMYLLNKRRGHHVACLTRPSFVVINGEITLTL